MFVDDDILAQFIEAVKQDVISAQKQAGKDATGKSINSYETEVKRVGPSVSATLYGAEYFDYINDGRGPGKFPPLNDIRIWAEARGILEGILKEYQKESIVYAIAKKISERGTRDRDVGLLNYITDVRIKALVQSLFDFGDDEITKQVKLSFGKR